MSYKFSTQPTNDDSAAQMRAIAVHNEYIARKQRLRARRLGDIAAALGIVALITAGVSITFIFLWAGFDPGMVRGGLR